MDEILNTLPAVPTSKVWLVAVNEFRVVIPEPEDPPVDTAHLNPDDVVESAVKT